MAARRPPHTQWGQAAGGIGDQQTQVAPQGKQAGMGHVQDAKQTINQRQPNRNNGVHTALYQALNEQFQVKQLSS